MNLNWFLSDPLTCLHVVISTILAYFLLIICVKVNGLRSFAKMSSFDFGVTVAIGSLLASMIVSKDPPIAQGATALITLLLLQSVVAKSRVLSDFVEDSVDNCPLLLMDGPNILEDNLRKGNVTKADVISKLREANVLRLSEVRAVILEATGDVSVLHSNDSDVQVEDFLLEGLRS